MMNYINKDLKCKVCNIGHLFMGGIERDVDLIDYAYYTCSYCGATFEEYEKEKANTKGTEN